MHDDRAEVHKDPAPFRPALDLPAEMASLALRVAHTLGQGTQHAVARARPDDEVVRKHTLAAHVEQDDVFGLPGLQCFDKRA